ncbi:polysaccharide deacetylase family protein [Flavobacterium sp. CYK-55]|uniref:polysaccharide deacetylase family protein n=1 Tax=Flavobacterium sp. CYK-55 TaxID=2835529 RepID=UPI00293D748E|nr:polysaccharide deacetylase family protein [Flavobacterium sp. CYK-55]
MGAFLFQMKWYWIKTSQLVKWLFRKYIWDIPTSDKIVYLTFDDGPTPKITPWVLDQLDTYQAKATFFCIGDNIRKFPEIYHEVNARGHQIGNHTYHHLNGWKTGSQKYIDDALLWETIAESQNKLFRPPYGKIKSRQAQNLMQSGYKMIMWDVLSADFDPSINPETCLENVIKNIQPGSIVVFHDSVKAFKNLEHALPQTLRYLKENGYECAGID